MKLVVLGCTHAGTAVVKNARSMYPDMEISVYERNDNISFLSCGIALYVGGDVDDKMGLFYSSPEELASLNIQTHMQHDVVEVDTEKKVIKAVNLVTNEEVLEEYDKLVVTTGSWPVLPCIEGDDSNRILLCKNFDHAEKIISQGELVKRVMVVGAGYIGVELAEAFRKQGKEVILTDGAPRILSKYLDKEFTDVAEKTMADNGIQLAMNSCVDKFEEYDGGIKVYSGDSVYDVEMVIMSVGFRPNTGLFTNKLDMLPNGAIKVDERLRTSDKNIFAAGDCCSVHFNPAGDHRYIPLATNALRMGTIVASNLVQDTYKYIGTQGTSGIKIYKNMISSTGLTVEAAKCSGLDVSSASVVVTNKPAFMHDHTDVMVKLVYENGTNKIKGAQILSEVDMTNSMNTISLAIQKEMTVEELAFVDFFFMPHFNNPWNVLNSVALQALEDIRTNQK